MRDTARTRVERAHTNLKAIKLALREGNGQGIKHIELVDRFAAVATAPIAAPAHGAEYARNTLFFTEELVGKEAAEAMAAQYDKDGVIWRPVEQLRAANKQIGRLRSDTVKAGLDTIPLTSLVYAVKPDDFTGHSYVELHDVKLPVNKSTGPELRFRVGRSWLPLRNAQLRYVEGPMVRAR